MRSHQDPPATEPQANDGGVMRRLECRLCSCDELCAIALLIPEDAR